MPYIQVWVDDNDCGPCLECEERKDLEDHDDLNVIALMREWHTAKERGNYELFERYLISLNGAKWHEIVYGVPEPVPQQGRGDA